MHGTNILRYSVRRQSARPNPVHSTQSPINRPTIHFDSRDAADVQGHYFIWQLSLVTSFRLAWFAKQLRRAMNSESENSRIRIFRYTTVKNSQRYIRCDSRLRVEAKNFKRLLYTRQLDVHSAFGIWWHTVTHGWGCERERCEWSG